MQDYIAAVTAMLKDRWPDGKIAFLGHMGDGNLHIAIGAGGEGDRHGVEACVYEPLRPIGGSISAAPGIRLATNPCVIVSTPQDLPRPIAQPQPPPPLPHQHI